MQNRHMYTPAFLCPHHLRWGAYRFAFVRPSVRTKKTSLCRAYLWNHCHYRLQGHIALGMNLRTLVFSFIPFYHLQSKGPWFCENMERKVCVARISETIATTDFKLQGYIVQGVNLCTWVFSSISFYELQSYGPWFC